VFGELDYGSIKPYHIKNVIVSGIGVFSDSYNLYAISLVFYPIMLQLHLKSLQASALTGASFFGAAVGAILFGAIADRIGRKPMYGIDLGLIFIGAFSQLFATNFLALFLSRLVLGFGIGGDLVMSPVIMAENSNMKDRGKLMAVAFSVMYLLGATLAAFVVQMSSFISDPSLAWRVVLAFGAVPSLFVVYYRRKIPETYRFQARVKGESASISNIAVETDAPAKVSKDSVGYWSRLIRSLPVIIAGSILWILYDTYSSTFAIYGPITIAGNLGLTPVGFTYAAVFLAGLPGTLLSVYLIDRIGRKKLVIYGYAGVFLALVLYSLIILDPSIFGLAQNSAALGELTGFAATLGFLFYLLNYMFSAMGPATIIGGTILVPELVPTKARASGQAINVFIDKLAAGATITSFPLLLMAFGLGYLILTYALIAIISSILIYYAIPETRGKTLEEISRESTA
jgi:MFS family permease